jgi:uncharacterized protein
MTGRPYSFLIATLLIAAPALGASDPEPHMENVERVGQARTAAYVAELAALDRDIAATPNEPQPLLKKCQFIQNFAWEEEQPIERSTEDSEQCNAELDERFEHDPDAQLFLLQSKWGEEGAAAGERLVPIAATWPREKQARLHEQIADSYRFSDPLATQRHELSAVRLDPHSRMRFTVAGTLIDRGHVQQAHDLINATPTDSLTGPRLREAVSLLLRLDAPADAVKLIRRSEDDLSQPDNRLLLAKALARAGDDKAAREIYEDMTRKQDDLSYQDRVSHFEFLLAHGSREEATDAYARLRDIGYSADPYGRYRLALLAKHPFASWQWRDLPGPLALLGLLVGLALLPLVMIAPVHYRSLAKRQRGIPVAEGPWGLRSIWMFLALLLITDTLVLYHFGYAHFLQGMPNDTPGYLPDPMTQNAAAKAFLASIALLALCLVPFLRGVDLRKLLLGDGRILRAAGLALLSLFVIRAAGFVFTRLDASSFGGAAIGDMTTQLILATNHIYGPAVCLTALAIVVPVLEEVAFRGLILQGLSRYLKFGLAALIQAALFAAFHESLAALPYIFMLGLAAAWLVHHTGGLLAAIILHGLNNAMAYGAIVAVSGFTQTL